MTMYLYGVFGEINSHKVRDPKIILKGKYKRAISKKRNLGRSQKKRYKYKSNSSISGSNYGRLSQGGNDNIKCSRKVWKDRDVCGKRAKVCWAQPQTVWRPPSFGTNLCRGRALTRAEGLQHHVRQCAQTPHHRRSLWPLQVHHQRALAPGQGARVARGAGSVYTHHLRPEVRQDHTAERGRGQAGQLHDPNALQRPGAPHLPQKAERSRQPSAFSNAAHPLLPLRAPPAKWLRQAAESAQWRVFQRRLRQSADPSRLGGFVFGPFPSPKLFLGLDLGIGWPVTVFSLQDASPSVCPSQPLCFGPYTLLVLEK